MRKLLSIFNFSGKKRRPGRAIVSVDFDNMHANLVGKKEFTADSAKRGITRLQEQIRYDIKGEIIGVYVFAPNNLIHLWEKFFYGLKLPVISCPKIRELDEGETTKRDTVDEIMIRETGKLIRNMSLTHLYVATGDAHFIPLYKEAHALDLKVITICASVGSLARELIEESDDVIAFPLIIKR
jgi:uncharacterized LabA/DUF88 family protein